MPVREKAIDALTQDFLGVQTWNGRTGECQTMPTTDWWAVKDVLDTLLCRFVDAIDWNRVLREAQSRHLALDHRKKEEDSLFAIDGVCGECVQEAVLALGFGAVGMEEWEKNPTSTREREFKFPEGGDALRDLWVRFARDLGSEGHFEV